MPWTDHERSHCRVCGRRREEGERLSARGKCAECGDGHAIANARELREHSGPWFQHWRRSCVAAFGGVLLDDLEADDEGA